VAQILNLDRAQQIQPQILEAVVAAAAAALLAHQALL
jgi:hypothetical protein